MIYIAWLDARLFFFINFGYQAKRRKENDISNTIVIYKIIIVMIE